MPATIVIDNGADSIKLGFSGSLCPLTQVPTIVGTPRSTYDLVMPSQHKSYYIGHDAQEKRGILSLRSPIVRGTMTNWDDMERIWRYILYDQLKVNPEDHPILLTEAVLSPTKQREKSTEIMFETFNTPAVFIQTQASLCLYASGRSTGLVVDIGHDATYAVPIINGRSNRFSMNRADIGGRHLTEYLGKLLADRGHFCQGQSGETTLRGIKEKLCFVSQDFDSSLLAPVCKEYQDTDGNVIELGQERFKCPEAFFNPPIANLQSPGVHELVHASIKASPASIHKDLYNNVVLAGGTSLIRGIEERLEQELKILDPQSTPTIISLPYRQNMAWIGGSILGSLDNFEKDYAISKNEYAEQGPAIVHRFNHVV